VRGDPIRPQVLTTCRARFTELLDRIYAKSVGSGRLQGVQGLAAVIEETRKFTPMVLAELMGPEPSRMLINGLRQVMVKGMNDLVEKESPLGIIELEGSLEDCLPLEYLFVDLRPGKKIPGKWSDLLVSLCQVVGFAFLVQRNVACSSPESSCVIRLIDNHISINVYAHKRLYHVEREIDFFRKSNPQHFRAQVDHPIEYGGDAASTHVARLWSARQSHFHHYCCHGITNSNDCWKHRLWFGTSAGQGELILEELYRAVIESYPDRHSIGLRDTISFLNACDAGFVTPDSRFSFPSLFVRHFGHRGFIGPEYRIPDAFACEFARHFYGHLLRLGHVGLALFRNRWFFAKKHSNPLGLFYSLYADPDLQLSETVESVNL
jgi:hypothetical protein